ncbi:stage III sporulation protein AF [Bacillus sp. FJAT-49736]|uniref:stage III sporulation protein AF n=1 Tax=Bacillus sp. FJAT-49736 TaxID=2833582 RepID=UPI001BC929D8|nr:stage III sporulation protein AF [Bacillus sp. FJAT-49736]MBS4173425.1 stage III sporulation protein AF [Bacillus sp. FJAT-49736]
MSFITEWVMNIIVFILLAMILDMLLPSSTMKKYTKLVTGLLLIAIILTPILKLFSQDFDSIMDQVSATSIVNKNQVENSIEMKKKEIQASQDAYKLKQVAVQMKKDVNKELIDRFGKSIDGDIELKIKEHEQASVDNIDKIILYLKNAKDDQSVAAIEPIEIDTQKPVENQNSVETESITAFLIKKWNLTNQSIELHFERGNGQLNER